MYLRDTTVFSQLLLLQVISTPDGIGTKVATGPSPILGLPMKKSKVLRFQICCARTKCLSEIYKNRTIIVGAAKLFVLNMKGLMPKIGRNSVEVTFEASLQN